MTVESMEFEPDDQTGSLVEVSPWARMLERNAMTLIQIGVLSLVALVLALTVVKPLLTRASNVSQIAGTAQPTGVLAGPTTGAESGVAPGLPSPDSDTGNAVASPAARPEPSGETLRLAVADRPDETATMLREWLAPEPQPAGGREAA